MQIVDKLLSDIKPYAKNPRKNDKAVDKVAASIKEFGWKVPIVIDQDGTIVAGHTRYKAAQQLGLDRVPCIIADDLTPEQVKAFRLADNKVGELAGWDFDLLATELQDLASFDMEQFGFERDPSQDLTDVEEDDFEEEKETTDHGVQFGQVWLLGNHRVMCGDSTSKTDADRLMGGDLADFVFTDPPYGVAIGDKNKMLNSVQKAGRCTTNIEGDTLDTDDLHEMLVKAMKNLREHSKDSCSYYVSSPQGGEIGLMMLEMMKDAGLEVRHNLIWVKNTATFSMGRLDYDYRHEPIFYTWTKKHNFYGGYSTTVIDDSTPVDKMNKSELKDLVRALQQDHEDSVIYCDKPLKCDLHPTMKPVKLIAHFMVNSSRENDTVLDFFGGSGSTLMAAEQLHRRAFLMEIDPHYVDVILSRWEKFTGRRAELLNG